MARPVPDLLAPRIAPASRLTSFGGYRPAVCGHPTDMILTRAPSRAPFTLAVKIMSGPQTCSRAPVGSSASALRSDHRRGAAIALRQESHCAETHPPRPRSDAVQHNTDFARLYPTCLFRLYLSLIKPCSLIFRQLAYFRS